MDDLIHLIYTSAATHDFAADALATILDVSRRSNGEVGVTGMLLHSNGTFFQVLEGTAPTVDSLFARIASDSRHTRAVRIIREPIHRRSFGEWTMGFATLNQRDYLELVGLNDFFEAASCVATLPLGRARKLLDAFARGRWRATLEGAAAPRSVVAR
ncbi:MAG: BLUF domain-containing protein [Gemmatimonadota bacterium]